MNTKNERAQSLKTNTLSVHTNDDSTKKRKKQWEIVLEELENHKDDGITSWDMIEDHHITRTAAHICTLKKMGYEIHSELETSNKEPHVHYSRYYLIEDEDEDEDDDVCHDWVDEPYVSEDRLERRATYDAYGAWVNSRGW